MKDFTAGKAKTQSEDMKYNSFFCKVSVVLIIYRP